MGKGRGRKKNIWKGIRILKEKDLLTFGKDLLTVGKEEKW